jgi:8-oxo-dGTP diphosphatase
LEEATFTETIKLNFTVDSRQLYITGSHLSSVVTWHNEWIHFGTGREIKIERVTQIINDFLSGDYINFIGERANSKAYTRIELMSIITPYLGVHDFLLCNTAMDRVIKFSRIGVMLPGERKYNSSVKIKTGIGVIIYKSGKVLVGQRIGSHGANTWSFPGGHLEDGEEPEATARRELLEETGLKVNILLPAGFTFDHFEENNTSYITLFYKGDWAEGTPEILEKEKCLEWRWADPQNLPQPLFKPIASLLKQGGV